MPIEIQVLNNTLCQITLRVWNRNPRWPARKHTKIKEPHCSWSRVNGPAFWAKETVYGLCRWPLSDSLGGRTYRNQRLHVFPCIHTSRARVCKPYLNSHNCDGRVINALIKRSCKSETTSVDSGCLVQRTLGDSEDHFFASVMFKHLHCFDMALMKLLYGALLRNIWTSVYT